MTSGPVQALSVNAGCPTPIVPEALCGLISALRDELQQYGELLALLDRQHDLAGGWSAEQLLHSITAVQTQLGLIERARAARDRFHGVVAAALDQSSAVPFAVLIPLLPPDYRPLVEALVLENNQLLLRVQQRAHQNQVLVNRSAARMRQFVSALPTLRESDTPVVRCVAPPSPRFEVAG